MEAHGISPAMIRAPVTGVTRGFGVPGRAF